MADHDEPQLPDLATDPPRDASLAASLAAHDARREARLAAAATPLPAFEARLRERVAATMAARAPQADTPAPNAGHPARRASDAFAVAIVRGARRILPGAALAAAAALVIALATNTTGATRGPDVRALAYAGGAAGAALAGDEALGLPIGGAMLLPGSAR